MSDLTGRRVIVPGDGPDAAAAVAIARAAGGRPVGAVTPRAGDVLVVDEWTAEDDALVLAARAVGARVTVLAELLLQRTPVPVLAITGTAGKSTASRVAAHCLRAAEITVTVTPKGRAGNAWPDAALLDVHPTRGWFVAELTSTHLCHMDAWRGPDVGVVTNLWPDHVELHGSVAAYVAAKRRLVARARGEVVLNADDEGSWALRDAAGDAARLEGFGSVGRPPGRGLWVNAGSLMRVDGRRGEAVADWRPPSWAHPAAALAGCAAAVACGVPPEVAARAVATTPPLPHRRQARTLASGVRVIDDSLAATPVKALTTLRDTEGPLILVAGGVGTLAGRRVHADPDAGAALRDFAELARQRARTVVLFGDAAGELRTLLPNAGTPPAASVLAGMRTALRLARRGDTILVSPGFPIAQSEREDLADLIARSE